MNANVGIESVVAIPLEKWSLDYIQPKLICISRNGTCIDSSYPNPPDSKLMQFENEHIGNHTPYVLNNRTYINLNPQENVLDIKGQVPNPGYYVFIVQYYQPDFPGK